MQVRALGLQFRFHDLLRIVPGASGVRHKNSLIQTKQGDRNEVSDEEVGLQECKPERGEKHRQEDVKHSLLGILGADLDDFLRIGY